MKTLIIEWQRLLDEHKKTCPRCGSTEQEVENAVARFNQELKPFEINVSLVRLPQRKSAITLLSKKC